MDGDKVSDEAFDRGRPWEAAINANFAEPRLAKSFTLTDIISFAKC